MIADAPLSTGTGGKTHRTVDPVVSDRPTKRSEVAPVTDVGVDAVDNSEAGDGSPQYDGVTSDDLASAVLAGARVSARRRPRRFDRDTRNRIRRENLHGRADEVGRNRAGYSGPGVDPTRDPHRLGGLLGDFVNDQGWDKPLAEARVFADWDQLVGPDIAAHAHPQSLVAGELRIAAESTAWATQLRLLSSKVLARLVAELGPQVVTKLIISGPTAPSWKHGGRSVRGHRGPRDTYG